MITEIAREIRSVRKGTGLTQDAFVRIYNKRAPRELKLTRNLLTKYELGIVTPPATKYKKILQVAQTLTPPEEG